MTTRVLREPLVITDRLKTRFFAKTVSASSGCLIWVGAIQRNGYGAFKANGKKHDAHVLAWRIGHSGIPVPIGQLVMHSCDCRVCVNPEHLTLGTVSENMKHAHRDSRGDDFVARGAERPNAVLTEPAVRAIKYMASIGNLTAKQIGQILGVNCKTVGNVLNGSAWAHVSAVISVD